MVSNELILILVLALLLLVVFVFTVRIEKLKRRLNLVDKTFKQWKTNFNEFRGMCDVLERNFNATNDRVNAMEHSYEEWIPVIETVRTKLEEENEKKL